MLSASLAKHDNNDRGTGRLHLQNVNRLGSLKSTESILARKKARELICYTLEKQSRKRLKRL